MQILHEKMVYYNYCIKFKKNKVGTRLTIYFRRWYKNVWRVFRSENNNSLY